jgi:hypothetical protein
MQVHSDLWKRLMLVNMVYEKGNECLTLLIYTQGGSLEDHQSWVGFVEQIC